MLAILELYGIMIITTNKQHRREQTMTREQLKNLGYNDAAIDLIMEIIKEDIK